MNKEDNLQELDTKTVLVKLKSTTASMECIGQLVVFSQVYEVMQGGVTVCSFCIDAVEQVIDTTIYLK